MMFLLTACAVPSYPDEGFDNELNGLLRQFTCDVQEVFRRSQQPPCACRTSPGPSPLPDLVLSTTPPATPSSSRSPATSSVFTFDNLQTANSYDLVDCDQSAPRFSEVPSFPLAPVPPPRRNRSSPSSPPLRSTRRRHPAGNSMDLHNHPRLPSLLEDRSGFSRPVPQASLSPLAKQSAEVTSNLLPTPPPSPIKLPMLDRDSAVDGRSSDEEDEQVKDSGIDWRGIGRSLRETAEEFLMAQGMDSQPLFRLPRFNEVVLFLWRLFWRSVSAKCLSM